MTNKKLLENFLKKERNRRYALPIVRRLLQQRLRKGYYIIKGKMKISQDKLEEEMPKIFQALVEKRVYEDKQYDASLLPTTISPELAPNFYIGKESPTEEEIYRFFYIIISGIYRREYIVNLDNIDEKLREKFREDLIREELLILPGRKGQGVNIKKMLNDLGIRVIPQLKEFIYSFILTSFFTSWIKSIKRREEWIKEVEKLGLHSALEKIGIKDDTILVIFYIPRQKKKMYYIPRLKNFLLTWYGDYLEGKEDYPSVVKFIFSNYISDKQYRKLSSSLLNKFLYYFLNGHINGELLNKLINTKISYELKRKTKRIYGFNNAQQFFRILSRRI